MAAAHILSELSPENMSWILEHAVDIAEPHAIEIEFDAQRRVLYVHINGVTILRACRVGTINFTNLISNKSRRHKERMS